MGGEGGWDGSFGYLFWESDTDDVNETTKTIKQYQEDFP